MIGLAANDVDIWYRDTTTLDDDAVAEAGRFLSPEERGRRDRFLSPENRRDFAAAHDLVRRALSTYRDVPPGAWHFATTKQGKPFIDNRDPRVNDLCFSLSHTTGSVACAIGIATAVGIDVERINQDIEVQVLAEAFFASHEALDLERRSEHSRHIRFVELWTLKEAFLKAIGTGLSAPLSSISFHLDDADGIEVVDRPELEQPDWQFALFTAATNIRCAVAARGARRFRLRTEGDGAVPALVRSSMTEALHASSTGPGVRPAAS